MVKWEKTHEKVETGIKDNIIEKSMDFNFFYENDFFKGFEEEIKKLGYLDKKQLCDELQYNAKGMLLP